MNPVFQEANKETCLSGSKQRNGERPADIDIVHDYLVTILTLILFDRN